MSILPSQIQGSNSASSSPEFSLNPNSHHGPDPNLSLLPPAHSFGSIRISDPESSRRDSFNVSGPSTQPANDAQSSNKVSESETLNDLKMPSRPNTETNFQCHSGGQEGGSILPGSKIPSTLISSHDQQNARPVISHGNNKRSAGRKAQITNGNHLLNFQYDPISRPRPRPRAPPPRRPHKIKPYNKDLFLQANYKFVVLDSGYHTAEYLDPDKMLHWEDIICVRYSTPSLVQCPICLEHPLCPQITSCGHIYCFPCILRYLLMGKEDHKGDCWKKCPLCFVMLSPKDLYTVDIELLKQYSVGDTIDFMHLTRQKNSFTISFKDKQVHGAGSSGNDQIYDYFSKFIFTSDVDLSVRKAICDLEVWLAKADAGQVDDLEKLPYVCAALEQLEQRKKYWNDHQASFKNDDCQIGSHVLLSTDNINNHGPEACSSRREASSIISDGNKFLGNVVQDKLDYSTPVGETGPTGESLELQQNSNENRDAKDKDSYNFYQATDGQLIILHPLNVKCLLQHYGSYDRLPLRISGKILEFETVTQTEATRRRYRYLSHFSLTTAFQLCEIDLTDLLPLSSMNPFMDEIKKRDKQRKQLAKKMQREKIKAEASSTSSLPMMASSGHSYHYDTPNLCLDDFEALGSSPGTSSSPPVGGRQLFSSVTRLGFAAAHDSPSLRVEETTGSVHTNEVKSDFSGVNDMQSATTSFANIISRVKSGGNVESPKVNEVGKKGKKPSRVLLSTAGGRRY